MGYSEFPYTLYGSDYQGGDMGEFIDLYKKLVADYTGTLNQINALDQRLTTYETNLNTRISDLQTKTIPSVVKTETTTQVASLTVELKAQLADAQQQFNAKALELENSMDRITECEQSIELLRADITNKLKTVNDRIDQLTERCNSIVEKIESDDIALRDYLTDVIIDYDNLNRSWTVQKVIASEERAERYTDQKIHDVNVVIDDLKLSTDTASIKGMWDYVAGNGGYSAQQWYEDTEITCKDWNDKNITCIDWYVRARELFNWFYRSLRIFSPFTGKLSFPNDVLIECINFVKTLGMKAKDYDAKVISAQFYDSQRIKAFEYDFKGKEILNNV